MKKFLSFLLIMTVLATSVLVALPTFAAGETVEYSDEWTPIGSLSELKTVTDGGKYYLTADITLDSTWTPIALTAVTLNGMDEGGTVHTVTFAGGAYSLFDGCDGLTVSNLKLDGSITVDSDTLVCVSPLTCGPSYPTETYGMSITDVTSDVDITVNSLAGNGSGSSSYTLDGETLYKTVGGVVAYMEPYANSRVEFTNVKFTGSIAVNCRVKYLGGISGGVQAARDNGSVIVIEGCERTGSFAVTPIYDSQGSTTTTTENEDGTTTSNTTYYDNYSAVEAVGGLFGVLAGNTVSVNNCIGNGATVGKSITGDLLGPIDKAADSTKVINAMTSYLGGLVGNIWGADITLTNCDNLSDGTVSGFKSTETMGATGGVIGRMANVDRATVDNCNNYAKISGVWITNGFGGVIGRASNNTNGTTVINCTNRGDIHLGEMQAFVGGIIGMSTGETISTKRNNVSLRGENNITIERCENYGNITYDTQDGNATNKGMGGILGMVEAIGDDQDDYSQAIDSNNKAIVSKHYVLNCRNFGNITSPNTDSCVAAIHGGGIVGKVIATPHLDVRHCINEGDISLLEGEGRFGWSEAAGIVGGVMTYNDDRGTVSGTNWWWSYVSGGDIYVYDSHNFGKITAWNAAGVLGSAIQIYKEDVNIYVDGCTNSGSVNAQYVQSTEYYGWGGGIVGAMDVADRSYGNLYINACTNYAAVQGAGAGGILGARQTTGNSAYTPQITQITNCANFGAVTALKSTNNTYVAAGIIAGAHGNVTVQNCANYATIMHSDSGSPRTPIALHMNKTGDTYADGYTVLTESGNYCTAMGDGISFTQQIGTENAASAQALADTNEKLSYGKGTVSNGGVDSDYSTQTYYIVHEHHLTGATRNGVELLLHCDITVENTAADLSRSLTDSKFDGDGKTVNFTNGGLFLFSFIKNSEIKNLNLAGDISTDTLTQVAPLSAQGSSYGLVLENVKSGVNITVAPSSAMQIGGVIGKIITEDENGSGTATLTDVQFTGKINCFSGATTGGTGGVLGNIGGITPTAQGDVTFTACINTGTVTSKGISSDYDIHNAVGGLVGSAEKKVAFEGCNNNGAISVEDTDACVGGIAGHMCVLNETDTVTVNSCENTAAISAYIGAGIIGGVCSDSITGTSEAALTVTSCTNSGAVTGVTVAGGIVGDTTDACYATTVDFAPSVTVTGCTNTARVYASKEYADDATDKISFAGGIVASSSRILVKDCLNSGEVEGWERTGGILGGRHFYGTTLIEINNCKNQANITGYTYTGGIVGLVNRGKLLVTQCVNTGAVKSTRTTDGRAHTAGGIVGFIEGGADDVATTKAAGHDATVEKCVNAGSVGIATAAGRQGDGWKTVGGIIGLYRSGVTVTGCVHFGELTEAGNTGGMSSFPIANALEKASSETTPVELIYSGNYYSEGSVPADYVANFKYSAQGDTATLEATVRAADVYVFDRSCLKDEVELAADIIADGYDLPYTDGQKAALDENYASANGVYTSSDPLVKQSAVYDAEDALRDAIYDYADSSSYIVYIPETKVASGFEYTVEFRPTDFTRFSTATVELDSKNGFVLKSSGGDELPYELQDENGNAYTDGGLIFEREQLEGQPNTAISKVIVAVVNEDDTKPAGTYRDSISFTVTYDSGKPATGT